MNLMKVDLKVKGDWSKYRWLTVESIIVMEMSISWNAAGNVDLLLIKSGVKNEILKRKWEKTKII